jgi:transposase
MIKLTFSLSDIEDLNYWRFHHPDPIVMKRCETVYLRAKGLKTGAIHDLTGRDVKTIRSHLHLYNTGGIEGLKHCDPYRPASAWDVYKQSIEEEFRLRPPASLNEAGERMYQLTGIRRSGSAVEVFVKRLGMKFLKVGGIPAKADLVKQEEFIKKKLEPAVKSASEGKLHLYFMDAAHFVWGTGFLMSLWCFVRMFVRTASGRKRYNVLGAYNAVTRSFLSVVNETYINSSSVCEMLRLLRRSHVGEAITVILDNAAYQRCLLVQSLAAELDITLEFLPSDSPNLNLIERLWKFTKKQCLNNRHYETFAAFKTAIDECVKNIDKRFETQIATLMTLKCQTFKNDHIRAG